MPWRPLGLAIFTLCQASSPDQSRSRQRKPYEPHMEQAKTPKAVYFGVQHACERCGGQNGCICQVGSCYAKAEEVYGEKPLHDIIMLCEHPHKTKEPRLSQTIRSRSSKAKSKRCRMSDWTCCIASGTLQKCTSPL